MHYALLGPWSISLYYLLLFIIILAANYYASYEKKVLLCILYNLYTRKYITLTHSPYDLA